MLLEAWPGWLIWRATERKFLPYAGGLMDQPEGLLSAWLTLDGLLERVEAMRRNQEEEA